eukprot:Tamp_11022.p1 GENE.Tamp_11022~~Tamp_11022.p1  ORF type:complete len:268 (-),score=75.88 Tamp_11022:400-1203(-)
MHRVRAIATSRVAVNCALLTSVQRTGKAVVPTQSNFTAPQRELHSMSGMAQGPSAVSDGGGAGGGADPMDRPTRMSLENEDAALNAAIEASLQDGGVLPSLPPDGCVDDDSQRGRSDSASLAHYTDSLRVVQEMEFAQALEQDRKREEAAEEERKRMQAAADEVRKKEEEHEQMLQRVRDSLPPEPENGSPGVAALMMRFPDGQRFTRRFLESHTFKVVQDYMLVNGADPASHTVATSFPRKVLSDSDKTLGELGLAPQMALIVEPK